MLKPLFLALLSVFVAQGAHAADVVMVKCETTKGPIRIEVHPEWSPIGVDRYLQLVDTGFFTNVGFGRVVKGFLVQFGIAEHPADNKKWGRIKDDVNLHIPVERGTLAYAGGGMDSRTTQVWISFADSAGLGKSPWETPLGKVLPEDMHVVDSWYSGYGDMAVFGGHGPDQGQQTMLGNKYLKDNFPELDYMLSCERMPAEEPLAEEQAPAEEEGPAEEAPSHAGPRHGGLYKAPQAASEGGSAAPLPQSHVAQFVPHATVAFLVLFALYAFYRYKKVCEIQTRKAVESV